MPTKTERILGYLPRTFRALPRPTALYAVVDAFGSELLQAENSLAAVMQAHWVDHADRGAEEIDDLACLAALYGLAPRADEDVEGFREHLKRYIRTTLEGTVTVQGILRVTAEALGLRIADAYEDMDTWWTREEEELVTTERRGNDAAALILGTGAVAVTGSPARAAQVSGTVDLSSGVDLREASVLRLNVDDAGPVEIDLQAGAADPSAAMPDELESAINDALGAAVASHDGRYLTLSSPTSGASSRLEVQEGESDAAGRVLGIAPRTYRGSDARPAQVRGAVDLSGGVDLTVERYLRLAIDGRRLAEVDCAGPDPAHTTLDQVRDAINDALGLDAASHDGSVLTLTSPTVGFQSTIALQRPAAQEATERLFGAVPAFHTGQDAQPARLVGQRDLSTRIDLSEAANIRVSVDGEAAVTIDCAGADPANTLPAEIVAAINAALGEAVASHNGRAVTLASPTAGAAGEIVVEEPASGDATEAILGIGPRIFEGADATAAQYEGAPDLSGGVDLIARHLMQIAVDGGPATQIDLLAAAGEPRAVTPGEVRDAINSALGGAVATHDGQHVTLISRTMGSGSSLSVAPLEVVRRRRFLTRAAITDEASQTVMGFVAGEAWGTSGTRARVVGQADLSRGVDLREMRYLRLALDDRQAVDIDCAGRRPRATLIDEVVDAINAQTGIEVAAHDGCHLVLTSPNEGEGSRIRFEAPRATDALEMVLGVEPGTYRGQDATQVRLVGTVDLSAGIDLPPEAAIKLGIDGGEPVEIALGDAEASHKTLNQIVMAINVALEVNVASHDGRYVILTSPSSGETSRVDLETPDGPDATEDLLGIIPPRAYRASDAAPAKVVGKPDLGGGVDLRAARYLRVAANGGATTEVDCAAEAADPAAATVDEIVAAINGALDAEGGGVASRDGAHLVLRSKQAGLSGRIALEHHTAGDARQALLGDVPDGSEGSAPAPAVLTGEVDLRTPVDLSERRWLRLAVDGARAVEVDVAGAAPAAIFADEVVAAINEVLPGVASVTEEGQLRLTSPSAGAESHVALLPVRYLELIEYPPEAAETPTHAVQHGDGWTVDNEGAAEVLAEAEISAPHGVVGPTLVNETLGWRVRLLTVVDVGGTARVWRDGEGELRAAISAADGTTRSVPGAEILAGPLGAQAWVPTDGEWPVANGSERPGGLQLNDPPSPRLVLLRARHAGAAAQALTLRVDEAALEPGSEPVAADGSDARLAGRLREKEGAYHLVDADEDVLAELRAGPGVDLAAHRARAVAVEGPLHAGEPPLMVVQEVSNLFDVTLRATPDEGEAVEERYPGVTIGLGRAGRESLAWQINTGPRASRLVAAEELDKGTALRLPRGRSRWRYLDCDASRFDQVHFDAVRFAGGRCHDPVVFDVSRFAHVPPDPVAAVFASSDPSLAPPAEVVLRWANYRPGAFHVHLPVDLPARFGGRFNESRFGQAEDAPELYPGAVTEPPDDEAYLVDLINAQSSLVEAAVVARVPLGWEAATIPYRKPQYLSLGAEDAAARLYLTEAGIEGYIELQAREAGTWGNEIAVTARRSGPAMYDVSIIYEGIRFENARQVVLGLGPASPPPACQKGKTAAAAPDMEEGELPALIQTLLRPGPIGVLQAKAAGIRADVTRERTEPVRERTQLTQGGTDGN